MVLSISCDYWPSVYLWRTVCSSILHSLPFVSWLLGFKGSSCTLVVSPLSGIFLYSLGCLHFLGSVLWSTSVTYVFPFVDHAFTVKPKSLLLILRS